MGGLLYDRNSKKLLLQFLSPTSLFLLIHSFVYSYPALFLKAMQPYTLQALGSYQWFLSRGTPCSNMIFGSSGISVKDGINKEKASSYPEES